MTDERDDLEHLRLLSIFHYVVAALAALLGSLPLIHVTLGAVMMAGVGDFSDGDPVAGVMGCLMLILGAGMVTAAWGFAVCLALAGHYLAGRRSYTFCLVMAAVACVFMPFGTVLGVFTILVLMRPSVRQLFGVAPAAEESGGAGEG